MFANTLFDGKAPSFGVVSTLFNFALRDVANVFNDSFTGLLKALYANPATGKTSARLSNPKPALIA